VSPGGGVDDTGADPLLKARSIALELLARREHSYHELLGELQDRLPTLDEHQVLRPVLDQLVADNLQSDVRFVDAYVRYRSSRRRSAENLGRSATAQDRCSLVEAGSVC